jgi:hypothetical protein
MTCFGLPTGPNRLIGYFHESDRPCGRIAQVGCNFIHGNSISMSVVPVHRSEHTQVLVDPAHLLLRSIWAGNAAGLAYGAQALGTDLLLHRTEEMDLLVERTHKA